MQIFGSHKLNISIKLKRKVRNKINFNNNYNFSFFSPFQVSFVTSESWSPPAVAAAAADGACKKKMKNVKQKKITAKK